MGLFGEPNWLIDDAHILIRIVEDAKAEWKVQVVITVGNIFSELSLSSLSQ